jgi:hypothetical protein
VRAENAGMWEISHRSLCHEWKEDKRNRRGDLAGNDLSSVFFLGKRNLAGSCWPAVVQAYSLVGTRGRPPASVPTPTAIIQPNAQIVTYF